jgi:hypothetical protein
MKTLKLLVSIAAIVVFLICLYTFFLGNEVFDGKFKNDTIAWYFLAKGIFCGTAMYLLVLVLEQLREK